MLDTVGGLKKTSPSSGDLEAELAKEQLQREATVSSVTRVMSKMRQIGSYRKREWSRTNDHATGKRAILTPTGSDVDGPKAWTRW